MTPSRPSPDRADTDFQQVLDALDGHPLGIRAVLLRLADTPPKQLHAELEAAFTGADGDDSTRRIFAALHLLDAGLPDAYAPLLALIGPHRRFLDIDDLEQMAKAAGTPLPRATLEQCIAALEAGGLLQHQGQGIHQLHPALSGFLAEGYPPPEPARRAFVDFMGRYADRLAPKKLYEQRGPFAVHGGSFHQALALALAAALGMDRDVAALTQSLAAHAQNLRDLAAAGRLFEAFKDHCEARDDQDLLAGAYHQLGMIAKAQRDFAAAGAWALKAIGGLAGVNDRHSLGIALGSFLRILRAANAATQTQPRQAWQQAGRDQIGDLAELERRFAEQPTDAWPHRRPRPQPRPAADPRACRARSTRSEALLGNAVTKLCLSPGSRASRPGSQAELGNQRSLSCVRSRSDCAGR